MNAAENGRNHDNLVDPLFISITKRLRHIAHKLDKHSKYLQENYNVTVPQIITLREIYEHGPISSTELTHIVSLNASTITGIIDRLERQGLVRRTRAARDRRRIDVAITEEGISFLKRIPPPVQQSLIDGLQELSVEEIDRVLWSIETIVSLLQRDEKPDEALKMNQQGGKFT
jgi:MarR family transcriptional regulator, organic hydroperoxide resistance regulator